MDKNPRKRNRIWCSATTSLAPLNIKVKRVERKTTSNEEYAVTDVTSESQCIKTKVDNVSDSSFCLPSRERTPEKAIHEPEARSPIIGGRFHTPSKSPVLCYKNKFASDSHAIPEKSCFNSSQAHNSKKSLSPVIGNYSKNHIDQRSFGGSPDIFASQQGQVSASKYPSPSKHFVIEDVSSEDEVRPSISCTQSSQESAEPSISFTQLSHKSANPTIEDVSTQEMLNSDYEGCRRADIDVDFVLYSKKPNRERLKAGGFAEKNRKLAALRQNFAEIWKHELLLSKTEQYPLDDSQVKNFLVQDIKWEFNCAIAICVCEEKQSLVLLNRFVESLFQIGNSVCVYPPFKVKIVSYQRKDFELFYNVRKCSVK